MKRDRIEKLTDSLYWHAFQLFENEEIDADAGVLATAVEFAAQIMLALGETTPDGPEAFLESLREQRNALDDARLGL